MGEIIRTADHLIIDVCLVMKWDIHLLTHVLGIMISHRIGKPFSTNECILDGTLVFLMGLDVCTIICSLVFNGLCKGISPQNMA